MSKRSQQRRVTPRAQVLRYMRQQSRLSVNQAGRLCDISGSAVAHIAEALKEGNPVSIAGFGRFKPRKARAGGCRNPSTGKKVAPPHRKSVTFRPSAGLKAAPV